MILILHVCILVVFVAFMNLAKNGVVSRLGRAAAPSSDLPAASRCRAPPGRSLGARASFYVADAQTAALGLMLSKSGTQRGLMQLVVFTFLLAIIVVDVLYLLGVPLVLRVLRALLLLLTIPLGLVGEFREQLHHFDRLASDHDDRNGVRRVLSGLLSAVHESTFGLAGVDRLGAGRLQLATNPHTIRNGLTQHMLWVFRGAPPFELRPVDSSGQRLRAIFRGTGEPFAKLNGLALVWCFFAYTVGSRMRSDAPPSAGSVRAVFDSFTVVGVCIYCLTVLCPRFMGTPSR